MSLRKQGRRSSPFLVSAALEQTQIESDNWAVTILSAMGDATLLPQSARHRRQRSDCCVSDLHRKTLLSDSKIMLMVVCCTLVTLLMLVPTAAWLRLKRQTPCSKLVDVHALKLLTSSLLRQRLRAKRSCRRGGVSSVRWPKSLPRKQGERQCLPDLPPHFVNLLFPRN